MNEQAIIRQIGNMDAAEVKKKYLQITHQMQDHLNAIRSGEIEARKEWVNSQLIFPEEFTEEMNKLSSDLHPIEKLLKQLEHIRHVRCWTVAL